MTELPPQEPTPTEDAAGVPGYLDEASLYTLYQVGADEYDRLCDQPGVDRRDGVGLSEKIAANTGVKLNVAAAVVAIANSARHNSNKE